MTIREVTSILEQLAPLGLSEDFDNTGLLLGSYDMELTGILVTLDTLENVVDEAIAKKCNLIVSFHPIIFKGLKKITGADYVQRVVMKCLQHNIAIYSPHTALDQVSQGVNGRICDVLELEQREFLIPKKGYLKKIQTYVPVEDTETVLEALFQAGAGSMAQYDQCAFRVSGSGSFRPSQDANPTKGEAGKKHVETENMIHVVFPLSREREIVRALKTAHPYEEVAYEIFTLDNPFPDAGMGMLGRLNSALPTQTFLNQLKTRMKVAVIRHSELCKKEIKTVAVLGGSGAFAIGAAKAAGADILITADIKYHEFFQAEGEMIIADIGHFETEQFTKNLLVEYLKEKIPNFAVSLSESITNPINYF